MGLLALVSSSAMAAETLNGFDLSAYGFIRANSTYATGGLASFNNINMSAPTHAVAQTNTQTETSRASFQTQQSRIGFNLKKGENISAKLEFDFVDFNKSSPTTQMVPRVRIAAVTYAWENQKVIIGQDWDLFSPVTAFTYNYVSNYFLAGNTGFMRQQAQYLNTQGNWEFGAAVGMPGSNPGVSDADLELAKSPSYSIRITRNLNKGRIGVSGIFARLEYQANKSTHEAYAGNFFYEQAVNKLTIRSEAYYGQNLSNIGSLAIGKGTSTSDVKEFGGFLTMSYELKEKHGIFGGFGTAVADTKKAVTPFSLGTTGAITNPGILNNFVSRLGYEYKIAENFYWISEFTRFETKSKISNTATQLNTIYQVDTGITLRF